MARSAISWLQTFLPMLDMGSPADELRRSGNEHRQFIPVNAYRTRDGYIYAAIGSDTQWSRFVASPIFASLDQPRFSTNEGRRADKDELHRLIGSLTGQRSSEEIAAELQRAKIPHAPISPIEGVMDLPFVGEWLTSTHSPDGQSIRLPPAAVQTPYLDAVKGELSFSPSYGEHTNALLGEIGMPTDEIARLRETGAVA
jgi:crotonobetainyl-CoA:carnitine CoA-transferase CaiB-like acyl-CoA transferase